MKSRREVLKSMAIGVGVAVPAVAAVGNSFRNSAPQEAETSPVSQGNKVEAGAGTPAPWQLIAPYKDGDELAFGWRIAGLTGAIAGAYRLSLANIDGRSAQVHVCRKDARSSGVAQTGRLDFVVMNGAEGTAATGEDLARALRVLGADVTANENQVESYVFSPLMSHEERIALYANHPQFQGVLA